MTSTAAPATVTVRPLQPADAAFAAALSARSFPRPMSAAQFLDEAARDDRDHLVAELDGVLVGFAGAWDAPDMTHVTTIAVGEHARRRGVATALLTALIDRSAARGADAWTLEVRADDDGAQRLYAGLGFVEVGRRPRYYAGGPDGGVDAVLMTRTTPPRTA